MQIGEKCSAPAVGGAASAYSMSTDATPLAERLAAHAATVPRPHARDAGGGRALAQSDALRAPHRAPLRDRDLLCRRSPLCDKEQATREPASDAAIQMAAGWWAWQPPRPADLPDGARLGGASSVNDAEGGLASARAQEDGISSADGDRRNVLSARAADDIALPVARSPSGQWRRGAAQAADTPADNDAAASALTTASVAMSAAPMGMASPPRERATTSNLRKPFDPTVVPDSPQPSAPAIAPDSRKTTDGAIAPNPMTTLDPAVLAGQRAASSMPAVGAAAIGDPRPDRAAGLMTGAGASAVMTARRSGHSVERADPATDCGDAPASRTTPIEREGAQQPSEGAPQQQMPVGSANDGLHTALYPAPSPENMPMPTAASSPDPRPRPDPQAGQRPAESPVASPTPHDAQVTRLSVPFNSWPSQSRVELSLSANDPGMPSIRMQPSSDGVRQALEQAWPTASADWALEARDDGMPDRRHARSPQQDDEDEDTP